MAKKVWRTFCVYILTNPTRSALYTGVTNDVKRRLAEHREDADTARRSFAGRYNCRHILHVEEFRYVLDAIDREKEIKGWSREKKLALIAKDNPEYRFIEDGIF